MKSLNLAFVVLFLCGIAYANEPAGYSSILPTGSMRPVLTGGEKVELYENDGVLNNGEIVVFERTGIIDGKRTLVMHRVVFQLFGCIITKGDALLFPDFGCQNVVYKTGRIISTGEPL